MLVLALVALAALAGVAGYLFFSAAPSVTPVPGPPGPSTPVATEGADAPRAPTTDELVARERAAALFQEERIGAALEQIEPLLEREPVLADDLVRAAICVRELGSDPDRVGELLERALELEPDDAAAHYVLGRHLFEMGEVTESIGHLARAAELLPDDYPTQLAYAAALADEGIFEEDEAMLDTAESILERLTERGLEFGGSWYLTTLYRYGRLLADLERIEESRERLAEWNRLKQRAVPDPQPLDLLRGSLGRVAAPAPVAAEAAPSRAAVAWREIARYDGLPSGGRVLAMSVRERWYAVEAGDTPDLTPKPGGVPLSSELGPGAWFYACAEGLWRLDASGASARVLAGDFARVVPIELGEDREARDEVTGSVASTTFRLKTASSDLELVAARGAEVVLVRTGDAFGEWTSEVETIATLPSAVRDLVASDVDHDGDLDLVVVGAFGARILRHDGAEFEGSDEGPGEPIPPGTFTLLEFEQSAANDALAWIVNVDLDTDNDVDLVAGGPDGLLLLDNERGGDWADRTARLPAELAGAHAPVIADFDGDALPDLFANGRAWTSRFGERFVEVEDAAGAAFALTSGDPFASGALDLVVDADGLTAVRPLDGDDAAGVADANAITSALGDTDRDGLAELALVTADGAVIVFEREPSDDARGLCLALEGVKDNARGVGAIVEVRAKGLYRRIYWRGEPLAIGLGPHAAADVLRVTWPNGVVQSMLDVAADTPLVVSQAEGLVGSCPFLYTWNGTEFVFVSDVIGITPLGLPMAPGMLVPPDHDEWVLVRGDQLAPKDGELVLQLTEELREVTYFDQVFLEAVDRPANARVFPNERFKFPPFPAEHLFTIEASHGPVTALGSDGRDWAAELAAIDGAMSAPFVPHRGQFLGLATPHTLDLEFDADLVANGEDLRLVLTGWLYWTDASVNMAAARHPAYEFVPPILMRPDGDGGWRPMPEPLHEPVGFPAGKTKTMVIDLPAGSIDPADPRIRVFSTLRLYWDEIHLATCGDDAPVVRTRLEPTSARLWERGFSEPIMVGGERLLEWFDWNGLAPEPRWNMHPGMYTKLGEVLPLVTAIDERFVIMGAGDCLTVTFDADALPPVPDGYERDWLVFLDGWAKDRDPNTKDALFVEPLPFHGMSAYPPPPGESYPDTPATRAYRREWLTRPAKTWIEPLVPVR